MNSADRVIALIDYALRRRFYFKNFGPDYNILSNWFKHHRSKLSNDLIVTLKNINRKITEKLGKEFRIGHTYFMIENLDVQKLKRVLDYAIIPLVNEYFFGNEGNVDKFVVEPWQSIVPELKSDYYIE